jgi:transcriptional regulator with XRE-family HTH domain
MKRTRLGGMFWFYRTVRGLSLRDLAPQIGIGHATLMRIEQGQAFDADTLLKLWAWLLAEDDSPLPVQTLVQKVSSKG